MTTYPKRLIEVDLPIKKISAHARREKSIRHGHISTLHIWWARRPLAACRAVICAALWPDPAQEDCPQRFRDDAAAAIRKFLQERYPLEWKDREDYQEMDDPMVLRRSLLDFIADFANWDNSTKKEYLETARALTQSAHEALGGAPGTRPLLVDPFAGGGSIPLEALRVGADAFASDLNPVAVLLNKVVLEYIPKYGQTLADEVRKWGEWIKVEAQKELGQFYPRDPDGATPIAYLWARTVNCEGPGCGAQVPLMRSLWLEKNKKRSVALRLVPHAQSKEIGFEIIRKVGRSEMDNGTSAGGTATCPICGFTTKVESVRSQLTDRHGGASDARLIAIVTVRAGENGHGFRLATSFDEKVAQSAAIELQRQVSASNDVLPLIPDGAINHLRGFFNIVLYGITNWGDLFTPRQTLTMTTFARLMHDPRLIEGLGSDRELSEGVRTCLALILDRVAVRCTSNCIWDATTKSIMQVFNQGQSLPARWEFMEMNPIIDQGSGWNTSLEYTLKVIGHCQSIDRCGITDLASATKHPLSDDAASAIITDPPYYAAVPYADLSDFFYSWLKRSMINLHPELFRTNLVAKDEEIVSLSHRASMYRQKDNAWFEHQMQMACEQGRRVCDPAGIGVFVFANKETSAWEAMLAALIKAGWIVTASWPIDTESGNRLRAKNSASLASSIHLVCRPREDPSGEVRTDDVGYWSDVLAELPLRIHAWLPGLAAEGIVGADAIFSCLGPALEIYSRYSRVEKASGEVVALKEYLEEVWAAVSREALGMIFEGGDGSGLEEDARLTAMWLWTLSTGGNGGSFDDQEQEDSGVEVGISGKGGKMLGFVLEYDAARKIAQGMGVKKLENLPTLVEIKGDKARLLPVSERTPYLFGQGVSKVAGKGRKKKKEQQTTLSGGTVAQAETKTGGAAGELGLPAPGSTVLDRLHQAMLLFSNGRSDALKRFIEEDISQDQGLWSLAQSLSALYPAGSEERRWVEGVLTRKKSLGL